MLHIEGAEAIDKNFKSLEKLYESGLRSIGLVWSRENIFAQYVIFHSKRRMILNSLMKERIPTAIYYPIPLHLQECFKYLNYKTGDLPNAEIAAKEVISLPMNAFMENEIDFIIDKIISIKNY